MKKNLVTLALRFFAFGLGFGINNMAFSDGDSGSANIKIGYVNVDKLLGASKALKAAEEQRVKSTTEMLKWYDTASADIQKQTTPEGKKNLVKKYEDQLTKKKTAIKDAYAKKVAEIDNQFSKAIEQKASAMGYNVVLRKDAVLFGGEDITAQILPLVK